MQRYQIVESEAGWAVVDQKTGRAAQKSKGTTATDLPLMSAVDLADGLNEAEIRLRRRQTRDYWSIRH